MKTIYNTLTKANDVQDFLNDGGKITVTYNRVAKVSDMYDVTNIVEIKCTFGNVTTFMNKFFRFSLFQVAMATKLIDAQGHITIEFTNKNIDDVMKNEFAILDMINEKVEYALVEIEYYEKEIEICNRRKELSEMLTGHRLTNKFIDSIRSNKTLNDLFADECIYFVWYNNDEIKEQLRHLIKTLNTYFYDGANYEQRMDYYETEYNRYMMYIA